MNCVFLVKSELINGDANERMSETITLEYGILRGDEKKRDAEEGGEGSKQKLR